MKVATETNTNTTLLVTLMNDYAQANKWAVDTLVDWLKTKPADLVEKELPSSFPGIRGTLVHIWDTERFWLAIVKRDPLPESYRFTGFPGTLEEVYDGIRQTSAEFAEYVASLGEEDLDETIEFNMPWVQGEKKRYQFLQHAFNHSSYHRGQAVTLGHHVGFHDAPMTDFSFYLFRFGK